MCVRADLALQEHAMTLTDLDPAAATFKAAKAIAQQLKEKSAVTRADLNAAMTDAFGVADSSGAWTQRDSFDMLEVAQALHFSSNPHVDAQALAGFVKTLPTQTVRSEEQIEYQAFSTPIDIAHAAVRLANIQSTDTVLEPSAGTGLLAALAFPVAARVHLNELNPNRHNLLLNAFPGGTPTKFDATKIDTLLASTIRPTVILMNPPFAKDIKVGKDPYAAVRHLRAAIRLLAPGGRLVAIMPDWFSKYGTTDQIYSKTFQGCTVLFHARLGEGSYRKHGTSIAVRLFVIDKVPGNTNPDIITAETAVDLDVHLQNNIPRAEAGSRKLLIPIKASVAPKPSIARKPILIPARGKTTNAVVPIKYEALDTPPPIQEQAGIYIPYRPSRIKFENAAKHPTQLVESVAMASIMMPKPNYIPNLPENVIGKNLLSDAQLETIIYANMQWQQDLPGRYKQDENAVLLKEDPAGDVYRKGFFLGDGTGAGKGRQIAGCIMDQWLKGNRRAIWISKNIQLLEDARRDWSDLGGLPSDIIPLSNWKINQQITAPEGIIFVPFGTLRSTNETASRLDQLITWATRDFEGIISFDEAHEMSGVLPKKSDHGTAKGSLQGAAGVSLQNALPRARVIYSSATGATIISALAYAARLGLWGKGTAFLNREAFIEAITDGGIAAMELLARELKALGQYMSRSLSFEGVQYEILKHQLTEQQIDIYNTYAGAWSIIHNNLQEALTATGIVDEIDGSTLNSSAKAAAHSRFESTKQRFFQALLLSMKLPTLIPDIENNMLAGHSCVIQVVSTAEAILGRRLNRLSPEEAADMNIEVSPLESMIDYLNRAFPTAQMVEYMDESGEKRSIPMRDEAGRLVQSQTAINMRNQLIETICSLPAIPTAIDAIIDHFGPDAVAEITGRTKRLIRLPNGTQTLQTRSANSNIAETEAFQNGSKRILVFTDAGGTGRSYHASLTAANQQQRVHYLVEPGWRSDRAIQGLGRTNRTHQASAPIFSLVTTDVRGELRFTSTIARRLDALGALTRGQRQTGGQNLFDPADNLETEYAKAALCTWYALLYDGLLKSITLDDFEAISGLSITQNDGTMVEHFPPITRWLNRILAMPIHTQNAIFEEFMALVETRVEAAREAGTLDLGLESIAVKDFTILDDTVLREDEQTGATTHLQTIKIRRNKKPMTLNRVLELAKINKGTFVRNKASNRVALRIDANPTMTEQGDFIRRSVLIQPLTKTHYTDNKLSKSKWKPTTDEAFSKLWQDEYNAQADKIDEDILYIATGLLLPIWNMLPDDNVAVVRIISDDGETILGRLINERAVARIAQRFNTTIHRAELTSAKIAQNLSQGDHVTLTGANDLVLKKSRVNGKDRYEVSVFPYTMLEDLKAAGCFTEIISYKTRVFFDPADPIATIDAIKIANA